MLGLELPIVGDICGAEMLVDFGIVEHREDNGGEFRLVTVDEDFIRARAVRELAPNEMRRALLLLWG